MYSYNVATNKWTIIHVSEKNASEEERGSPITALKVKRISDDAKKRAKGESLSPKERYIKIKQDLRSGSPMSPSRDLSPESPRIAMRKTFMKTQKRMNSIERRTIEQEDEAASPIVALMRNSIVMKAVSSDKKKSNPDFYRTEGGARTLIGKFPCGRDGHVAKVYGDKLYVFGGDRCQMAYNDLFAFPLT